MIMTKIARRTLVIVLFVCSVYAILRYHVFKGVEWTHFPLFIMNKIFAFSGFVLLLLSFALEPVYRRLGPLWFESRKYIGRSGFVLIIIHILMSFLLFRPAVYDKFFGAEGNLNAIGEWSMLAGVMGIAAYILIQNSYSKMEESSGFQAFIRSPFFGLTALLFSAFHVGILGFEGWMTPGDWPGGMPSISLVSTALYVLGMLWYAAGISRGSGRHPGTLQ